MKTTKIDYTKVGVVGNLSVDDFRKWVKDNNIDVEDLEELKKMMLISNAQFEAGMEAAKANTDKNDYDRAMGII